MGERSRFGCSSTPSVPTMQCAGQVSRKSGCSAKWAPGSTWWSRVATTWAYPATLACALIARATAVPPATARLPPSQKSFWTSTITRARLMTPSCLPSGLDRLQHRLAAHQRPRLRRQGAAHPLVQLPGSDQRLGGAAAVDQLSATHQRHDQLPVVVGGGDGGGADHLGGRRPVGVVPADGVLASAHRPLALGVLGD